MSVATGRPGAQLVGTQDGCRCGDVGQDDVDVLGREAMPSCDPRTKVDVSILREQLDGKKEPEPRLDHTVEDPGGG